MIGSASRSHAAVWPALPYADWKDTCVTLHLWTQIVGKVRLAQTPWVNHSWHVTLYVTPRGLTTSPIPYDGPGQLSHDDAGSMVAPAPLDSAGKIADHGNMGPQMAQSYANIAKVLADYGLTMDNIVEEVLYVTDMDAAFAVAGDVRKQAYGGMPVVASTILVTPRLALPDQLIEIKVIAKA